MALLDSEGFGWTNAVADLITYSAFATYQGNGTSIVTGGPLGDNYMTVGSSSGVTGYATRNLASTNQTNVIVGMRYNNAGNSNANSVVQFLDSALAAQCCVQLNPTLNTIVALKGTIGGTTLGTSSAGVFPSTGWFYLEISAVIATGTGGSITVKINNATVLTVTGVNTQNTANAGAARIQLGFPGGGAGIIDIAHYYMCDNTGSSPWNTFLGDVRVQTLVPTSNASVQFTPVSPVTQSTGTISIGSNFSYSANLIYYAKVIPPIGGQLTQARVYVASGYTGHLKMAIYSDSGSGSPSSLLASSAVVTNPTTGYNTFTFSSPTLVNITSYWFAIVSDTATNLAQNTSFSTNYAWTQSLAYASAFPSTAIPSSEQNGWVYIDYAVTPANSNIAAAIPPAPATLYNSDSTVSDQDTFNIGSVGASTTSIYGMHHKGIYLKSDSGVRSMESVLVSGGTTGTGSATYLGTTGIQVRTMFETDPNTSAQWTVSNANAAQPGYKISV